MRLIRADGPKDQLFGELVDRVQRQREEENKLHSTFLSFRAERSEVEESLANGLMAGARGRIRDVSTSLDMTELLDCGY